MRRRLKRSVKRKTLKFLLTVLLLVVVIFSISKLADNGAAKDKNPSPDSRTVKAAKELSDDQPDPKSSPVLEGKTIVLDPGHGGNDSGAIGQQGELEKNETLKTVENIKQKLEKTGANVILTRKTDVYVSLEDRVQVAEAHSADLFISIHYNSYWDEGPRGITSFYYQDQYEPLAELMEEHLFAQQIKTERRGARFGNYQVLRDNSEPAILLELGYISNPKDEKLMDSQAFQKKVATAVVEGAIEYLTK